MTSTPPIAANVLARAISRLKTARPPLRAARLAPYTTFAVGGPAELLIMPSSEQEAVEVLNILAGEGIPWRILGGGSNLLVSDGGVRGAVVRMGAPFDGFRFEGKTLVAAAGARLPALASAAAARGLSGLEFLAGIPGTAGGAAATNAGVPGEEIAGVLAKVRVFRPGTGIVDLPAEECGFAYRGSRFRFAGEVVLGIACELKDDDPSAVEKRTREILEKRRRTLPLELPSAGSVFKNPPGETAWRLIEAAGLKGFRRGGAGISEKHANWIVNRGKARSDDVESLIRLAREKVREKFGIELEAEIIIWDD